MEQVAIIEDAPRDPREALLVRIIARRTALSKRQREAKRQAGERKKGAKRR